MNIPELFTVVAKLYENGEELPQFEEQMEVFLNHGARPEDRKKWQVILSEIIKEKYLIRTFFKLTNLGRGNTETKYVFENSNGGKNKIEFDWIEGKIERDYLQTMKIIRETAKDGIRGLNFEIDNVKRRFVDEQSIKWATMNEKGNMLNMDDAKEFLEKNPECDTFHLREKLEWLKNIRDKAIECYSEERRMLSVYEEHRELYEKNKGDKKLQKKLREHRY
jgi:hypothetical protein